MTVKLISYSQPPNEWFRDIEGVKRPKSLQDMIAYAARVSNPANQNNEATAEKLIRYLAKHKHWSPFEMVSACLEIETTRDIARQILRHRSFSFQEFSQRYADVRSLDNEFMIREARLQDTKNRQNSIENEDMGLEDEWANKQMAVIETAKMAYNWAIEKGIAKEQARAVLPEGLTRSRLYMNGSIRSWIHYVELRTDPSTQKEHRLIALLCALEIAKVFPMIKEFAYED